MLIIFQAARPAPDPLVRKRKIECEEEENVDDKVLKKPKLEDSQKQISQEERLKNSTIPLWKIPYEQQVIQVFLKLLKNKTFFFFYKIRPKKEIKI